MKPHKLMALLLTFSTAAFAKVELGKTTMDIYGHVMLDIGIQTGQSNPVFPIARQTAHST